jgi:fermentation-respiration switch protein FrsA (DUF1100 family)
VKTLWALAVTAFLTGCVEGQFFYPDDVDYGSPRAAGLAHEDVSITSPAGPRLHGWWLPASGPAKATVLHLHGNAANVSNHLPLVAWLPARGYHVLMLDYRGFGRSEGKPTLNGVVDDARAALAWLRAQQRTPIVVIGQSLGGATALRAVAADPADVKLLVVDSAFASYRGIARDALGPLRWAAEPALQVLPGTAADPVTAVAALTVPVLVMHGTGDGVIPLSHGQTLYAAAREPKQWLQVEQGSHLDALAREPVRRRVLDAMDRAVAAR